LVTFLLDQRHGGGDAEDGSAPDFDWALLLEAVTAFMHVALEQAGITPDQDLKPRELAEIVPASAALDAVLTELDLLEQFGRPEPKQA
jgi:hypothetical protein